MFFIVLFFRFERISFETEASSMAVSTMYGIPQTISLSNSILGVVLESIVTVFQNMWFSHGDERVIDTKVVLFHSIGEMKFVKTANEM